MFTSQLHKRNNGVKPVKVAGTSSYLMTDYCYGKKGLRIFQHSKDSSKHEVVEYKVSMHTRLSTHKEFFDGDNSDVVGSDVMETNAYLHAQQYGLRTPEEFAMSLSKHLLATYPLVNDSNILVEKVNWDRLGVMEQGQYKGQAHDHAFTCDMSSTRFCEVVRKRIDKNPIVISGITGLRVVKTAKAPFTGYLKDNNLFSEGDQSDRILAIEVDARWEYDVVEGVDFNKCWSQVRDIILSSFAGDVVEGVIITSVQYASNKIGRAVLDTIPEIKSFSIKLLNFPHLPYDFSRFKDLKPLDNVIISAPKDAPFSFGYYQTDRDSNE